MALTVQLPADLQGRLAAYCRARGRSEGQAIEQAVRQFLGDAAQPTPYDLGVQGFGADRTSSGDIARNSKRTFKRTPVASS